MSETPVVVGTDLSQSADEAVRQASQWAQRAGAPLIVVHVASESVFQRLETPTVVAALADRLKTLTPAETEIAIEAGSPHAGLIHFAEAKNARLLVVGASGAGLARNLFGSTAEHTLRYAHCPVLIARTSTPSGPVLAATDFSDGALPAVNAAKEEARRRGSPLVLLHSVYDPPSPLAGLGPMVFSAPRPTEEDFESVREASRQTLQTMLQGDGDGAGEVVVTDAPPSGAIVEEAISRKASLIVVGTHGRTGFKRFALGSVAERVSRDAPCSVLTLRLSSD